MENIESDDIKKPKTTKKKLRKSKIDLQKNFISTIGFDKIPNEKEFFEGGFKRSDILFLIDLVHHCLNTDKNGKNKKKFSSFVNHFFRNGACSCLIGNNENKIQTYENLIKLVKILNNFDDKEKLLFLKKLINLKKLHEKGFMYKEGSNRIEVMLDQIEKIK